MVKNLCESCTHSSHSELTENAAGEEIFWYLCDKKYTYGSVKVSVPPHSKCSKYKPANKPEEKNW